MRTIYSFQEFYDDVAALAAQKNETYIDVGIRRDTHRGLQFSCYVNGYGEFFTGKTPEEAIAKLKLKMFPPEPDKNHVDIEIETASTEIIHA